MQETADGRYLLATDPGSNEVSVLRIKPHGGLQLADVESSNGVAPVSIAVHDGLVVRNPCSRRTSPMPCSAPPP